MSSHFENKKTVESVENTYGYKGLISIFNELDIDMTNWVSEQIHKERGGIKFMLPNAEGELYLNWGDLYNIDVTFVHSKKKFNETLMIHEVKQIIKSLEEQREKHIDSLRNMLKKAFSESEEE